MSLCHIDISTWGNMQCLSSNKDCQVKQVLTVLPACHVALVQAPEPWYVKVAQNFAAKTLQLHACTCMCVTVLLLVILIPLSNLSVLHVFSVLLYSSPFII